MCGAVYGLSWATKIAKKIQKIRQRSLNVRKENKNSNARVFGFGSQLCINQYGGRFPCYQRSWSLLSQSKDFSALFYWRCHNNIYSCLYREPQTHQWPSLGSLWLKALVRRKEKNNQSKIVIKNSLPQIHQPIHSLPSHTTHEFFTHSPKDLYNYDTV